MAEYYMSRLTAQDMQRRHQVDSGSYIQNPNSFHYEDILTHIPVQRQLHQQSSYAYRTNQMIKHAYEDNSDMTREMMRSHTTLMNGMSDKEAYLYGVQNGWNKG